MKILLATNNAHKKIEFSAIFAEAEVLLPRDVGLPDWTHDETADTFYANALGKAESLAKQSGYLYPVIADDSGICVDALGGAPGIYSARYGSNELGRSLTDEEKNALLLKNVAGASDRSARFICALALVVSPHRFYVVQESWEGRLAHEVDGSGGFGYDPIFFLPDLGTTSARLAPEVKNSLSHRGRASRRLRALWNDIKAHE